MSIEPLGEEVNKAFKKFINAFEQLDFERFTECFVQNDDVTIIFPGPSMRLINRGWPSVRQAWQEVFQHESAISVDGKLKLDISNLGIQIFGYTAIVTFLVNSSPPEIVHRRTIILIRENNDWLIVHLHGSNYDR